MVAAGSIPPWRFYFCFALRKNFYKYPKVVEQFNCTLIRIIEKYDLINEPLRMNNFFF
jgi:hypothetical protein